MDIICKHAHELEHGISPQTIWSYMALYRRQELWKLVSSRLSLSYARVTASEAWADL